MVIALLGSWVVAVLLVLRWFHVAFKQRAWDDEDADALISTEAPAHHPQLSSSLS